MPVITLTAAVAIAPVVVRTGAAHYAKKISKRFRAKKEPRLATDDVRFDE